MTQKRFLLSGGGTGGHIYPAIAIADELKRRHPDAEFLFVGAKDKMEMQKIPKAGYKIQGLWISGLQRKLSLQNAMFPLKLISSLLKSRTIINSFKPDVVIGTGGFASGPLLQVAARMGLPTLIQEQNSYPGITNKILGKKAKRICVAYPGMERFFSKEKLILTGNPVREDLISIDPDKHEAIEFFNLNPEKKTLLVLGGSLGARRINQLIAQHLDLFEHHGYQVIWQCGRLYLEQYKSLSSSNVRVMEFIERMDLVYAVADLVISRAGASSVSELCLVGKPVIFIPSPNVAEDHQTKNANVIVSQRAALMIAERDLELQFSDVFSSLATSGEKRLDLALNIKKLAMPDATSRIADEVEKLICLNKS
jgi:UDP-N-acetylglucosamine--N-acetylmuramyl-(pentapeptide) pyrophosphoryl-undecaprenol N-acetylglucosamine transferase